MRKLLKTKAVRAVFVYILFAVGSYMFLRSCSNSYNRLTAEKIAPASLIINGNTASVSILEHRADFSMGIISPESRIYYGAYLAVPDDVRLMAYLVTLADKIR